LFSKVADRSGDDSDERGGGKGGGNKVLGERGISGRRNSKKGCVLLFGPAGMTTFARKKEEDDRGPFRVNAWNKRGITFEGKKRKKKIVYKTEERTPWVNRNDEENSQDASKKRGPKPYWGGPQAGGTRRF